MDLKIFLPEVAHQPSIKMYKTGTEGANSIQTIAGNDYVRGMGGNDKIYTRFGKDIVYGGWGNDFISAGNDEDLVVGGTGFDRLYGGQYADTFQLTSDWGYDRIMDFKMVKTKLKSEP